MGWRQWRWRWRWLLICPPIIVIVLNWRLLRILDSGPQEEATTLSPTARRLLDTLLQNTKPTSYQKNITSLWNIADNWDRKGQIFPMDESIGHIIEALQNSKILHADYSRKGTQLKLALTLEGGEKAFFKPQWYPRSEIIREHVYSGKDRHNAEVVAFYLAAVLDVRWAPISAIRRINLQTDIWEKATEELQQTMFLKDDGTLCLYGKCHYCRKNESVCGDERNEIEGAVIHLIKGRFDKFRSPWQRTYNLKKQAEWEFNSNYCSDVKKALPLTRLLDLIDVAVFDYLIQNGDRHHYETIGGRIIYFDNGKGLGNPHKDFNDILAPLYQCCIIRHSTWKRLKMLSGGYLSSFLSALLSHHNKGETVVTEQHLQAMDRRLLMIYSVVNTCIGKHGRTIFKTDV